MDGIINLNPGRLAHFVTKSQATVKKLEVTFEPKQGGIGDASPSNIRPIIGYNSIEVINCGKNLYDNENYPFTLSQWIIGGNGKSGNDSEFEATIDYIPCAGLRNATITLNIGPGGTNPGVAFYNDAYVDTYISGKSNQRMAAESPFTFTVPDTANYMRFTTRNSRQAIQLELGDTRTVCEPYIGKTYSIQLGNTYYNGTVDLISGTFTATSAIFTFTGQEEDAFFNWESYTVPVSNAVDSNSSYFSSIMCSHIKRLIAGGDMWSTAYKENDYGLCACVSLTPLLRIRNRELEGTLESYRAWLQAQYNAGTPVQFVYKLANPITYHLTGQAILTLLGTNNIYSNAGTLQVAYKENTIIHNGNTNDSDSVAHFETKSSTPIKSLKLQFDPIQAGSGTPSASNTRAISGKNKLKVVGCGVNLLSCTRLAFSAEDWTNTTTQGGLTYTATRNSAKAVTKIHIEGTTTTDNAFCNLNYHPNDFPLPQARLMHNTFSNQIYIRTSNASVTWQFLDSDVGRGKSNSLVQDGTHITNMGSYLLTRTQDSSWASGTQINTDIYPQVTLYCDKDHLFEPYNGKDYIINLDDTYYGGEFDFITGKLAVNWLKYTINSNTSIAFYNQENGVIYTNIPERLYPYADGGDNPPVLAANYQVITQRATWQPAIYGNFITRALGNNYIFLGSTAWAGKTLDEIKSLLGQTPIDIFYKIESPIIVNLQSQKIRTLRGINNIWSRDGNITVEFEADNIKKYEQIFKPYQLGDGAPSPTNIRPIISRSQSDIHQADNIERLIPITGTTWTKDGLTIDYLGNGKYHIHGTIITSNEFLSSRIYVEPFTVPLGNTGQNRMCFNNSAAVGSLWFYSSGDTRLDSWVLESVDQVVTSYSTMSDKIVRSFCFKLSQSGTYDIIIQPIFITNYNQQKTISWQDNAGMIYGGVYDLISGKLKVTHIGFTPTSDDLVVPGSSIVYFRFPVMMRRLANMTNEDGFYCDKLPMWAGENTFGVRCGYWDSNIFANTIYCYNIPNYDSSVDTKEKAKQFILDLAPTFVAPVDQPIEYDLGPNDLDKLGNISNYFMEAEDNNINYDVSCDKSLELSARRIALNQPHLISLPATAHQTFTSNLTLPLKEARITFNPIQFGENDPSPNNVRSIQGFNTIPIHIASNNVANIYAVSAGFLLNKTKTPILSNSYNTTINTTEYNSDTILRITQNSPPDSDGYSASSGFISIGIDQLEVGKQYIFHAKVNVLNNPKNKTAFAVIPNGADPRGAGAFSTGYVDINTGAWRLNSTGECIEFRPYDCSLDMSEIEMYEADSYNVINLQLPSTIYGGYIDLINGTLVQTYASYTIDNDTVFSNSVNNPTNWVSIKLNQQVKNVIPIKSYTGSYQYRGELCDKIGPYTASGNVQKTLMGTYESGQFYNNIYVYNMGNYNSSITSAEALNNYLKELAPTFVYPIEPITYQIDPITLNTLRGVNNIWSTANGTIELSYWTH